MSLRHFSLLALLLASACGTTPESHNLRLDLATDIPPSAASLSGSLQVQTFSARGLLNERRLVYSDAQSPGERRQSASYMWEEYPSQAATLIAVQALRSAHAAKSVFSPDQPGVADYSLTVRLDRFDLGQDNTARVAIDATVVKNNDREKNSDRQIVLTGRYCARQPVTAGDSASMENAFDEAYRQTLIALMRDMTQMTARSSAASAC